MARANVATAPSTQNTPRRAHDSIRSIDIIERLELPIPPEG